MVGTVGQILGDAGVNIAGMQVSRDSKGGQALVALSVDSAIPAEALEEIARPSTRSPCARSTSPEPPLTRRSVSDGSASPRGQGRRAIASFADHGPWPAREVARTWQTYDVPARRPRWTLRGLALPCHRAR